MKQQVIEKTFTEAVSEFLALGYQFYTSTMTGHQGEIAKVDLYKGQEVVRVWLETGHSNDYRLKTVELNIGRWTKPKNHCGTGWMKDFEVFRTKTWYRINEYRDWEYNRGWFTTNKEEALQSQEKRLQRRSKQDFGHPSIDFTTTQTQEIGRKYMMRKHWKTRVSAKGITITKRWNSSTQNYGYYVGYRNKGYKVGRNWE